MKKLENLESEILELKAMMNAAYGGSTPIALRSTLSAPSASSAASGPDITTGAVSNALADFIDTFNSKAEKSTSPVSYMMSDVEIDLKVNVVGDSADKVVFKTIDPGAVSATSVKMAIKAVPKTVGK